MKRYLFTTLVLLALFELKAAERYWIAGSTGNWSDVSNWSWFPGGPSGSSVPGVADRANFEGSGLGDCIIDIPVNLGQLRIYGTYTSTIDLNGNAFQLSNGDSNTSGGTIMDTPNTSTFVVNIIGQIGFGGTTFDVPVDCTANNIRLNGSTFNDITTFVKTGAIDDFGDGGNTFVGNCSITNTGSGTLGTGGIFSDTWLANLDVTNNGTGSIIQIATNAAGSSIAGTFTAVNQGSSSDIIISREASASLSVGGVATISNLTSSYSTVFIGQSGDIQFNSDVIAINNGNSATVNDTVILTFGALSSSQVTIDGMLDLDIIGGDYLQTTIGSAGDVTILGGLNATNSGTGSESNFEVATKTPSLVTVNGTSFVEQNNSIDVTQTRMGLEGDVIWNGDLTLRNNSGSTNSNFFLSNNPTCLSEFNGNVIMTSEQASSQGIAFGSAGGFSTLGSGYNISVGAAGFNGELRIVNLTQLGTAAQNIDIGSGSNIFMRNSEWNGPTTILFGSSFINANTFNNDATLEQTGFVFSGANSGNTFNGTTTLRNTGNTGLRFSSLAGQPEDFNGDVIIEQVPPGFVQPSFNNMDTYAGDIIVNTPNTMTFGASAGRGIIMDGTTDQTWYNLGASLPPRIRTLQVNKASGEVNLATTIRIMHELDLVQGLVNSSTANIVNMLNDAVILSVSDASHVTGPVEKVGDDAFVFPVGDGGFYRSIGMGAPSTTSSVFRGQYFLVDPHPTYDHNSLDPTITAISSCEYWMLDRLSGASSVPVTLSWNNAACNSVAVPASLIVARWDGAVWRDHGNGGTTGTVPQGTVVSSGSISTFSPFTLASLTPDNPLPIELISFTAEMDVNNNYVDLNWSTASEKDNEFFTVERSSDLTHWTEVVFVDGAMNSQVQIDYNEKDRNPLKGVSYYRLKQTDLNGDYTYSDVRSVNNTLNGPDSRLAISSVYPNPFTGGQLKLLLDTDFSYVHVRIFDQSGRSIIGTQYIELQGNNVIALDVENIASGVYLIEVDATDIKGNVRKDSCLFVK